MQSEVSPLLTAKGFGVVESYFSCTATNFMHFLYNILCVRNGSTLLVYCSTSNSYNELFGPSVDLLLLALRCGLPPLDNGGEMLTFKGCSSSIIFVFIF